METKLTENNCECFGCLSLTFRTGLFLLLTAALVLTPEIEARLFLTSTVAVIVGAIDIGRAVGFIVVC